MGTNKIHKRRDDYTPYVAGDYSDDGLLQVVSTKWKSSYRYDGRPTHWVLVVVRVAGDPLGWKRSYPKLMSIMAQHCVDRDAEILAFGVRNKFYIDWQGWHREFRMRVYTGK